jgi:hypothetical protein
VPPWAQDWWQRHRKIDDERMRQDEESARQATVRRRAVEKLTPEEREELGV